MFRSTVSACTSLSKKNVLSEAERNTVLEVSPRGDLIFKNNVYLKNIRSWNVIAIEYEETQSTDTPESCSWQIIVHCKCGGREVCAQTRCITVTMPSGQIALSGLQVLLSSKLSEKQGIEILPFIEIKCYRRLPSLLYSYLSQMKAYILSSTPLTSRTDFKFQLQEHALKCYPEDCSGDSRPWSSVAQLS